MFSQLSLAFVLALSSVTVASPFATRANPINIPLARKFNFTGVAKVLEADQARAKALRAAAFGAVDAIGTHSVPVTNTLVSYTATVNVGTSNRPYTLIVDTGSANTWVGAQLTNPYVPDLTDTPLGPVSVTYGSGFFLGTLWNDSVKIGDLSLPKQGVGAALPLLSFGFANVDGILGIGPTDLTEDTSLLSTIPTVTDTAYDLHLLNSYEVSVFFAPPNSKSDVNGELTFGGVDSTKFTGSINYVPITSTSPASSYFGIDQSITYGAGMPILSATAGIVDTGTTLVLIASDAFTRYQAITGGVPDSATGLLKITAAQYANLQSLFFKIGTVTYEFTKNAQIFPRSLNEAIGGEADAVFLIVGSTGTPSGSGLDFINGMTFLERFYSVYDTGNKRVGFATTAFTDATSN